MVAAALAGAPGMPAPGSAPHQKLAGLLQAGVCPVDALRTATGTVNRQSLVALVRSLGGC